jgi:hypothetical protein
MESDYILRKTDQKRRESHARMSEDQDLISMRTAKPAGHQFEDNSQGEYLDLILFINPNIPLSNSTSQGYLSNNKE